MEFLKRALKRIKLFVLFWTRIVFVKNNFKVSFFTKLRMNFGGGYLADQYVLYDFKHNDKREYLSEFDWYRSRYINAPFDFAFNNKVICQEILKQYARMPENFFIKNKGLIYRFEKGVSSYESVYSLLIKKDKLVIKPFALGKGNGVNVFSYDEGKLYIDNNECSKHELVQFLERRNDYIICEFMNQHEYANMLYPHTVNTIRLITLRDIETHKFKINFAVQRIGRKETIPVDNGSKGGLVAKINLDRGVLSEARCLHDLDVYTQHPDSGNVIEGVQIPLWDGIKKEILELCERLPYMDFIAWDLLVTNDGLCIIEANASSGVNILQLWGGQRHSELGCFYKK